MVKIETTNSTQIDEKGGKQTLLIGKNAIYAIPETGWRTVITNTDHVSLVASAVSKPILVYLAKIQELFCTT